MTNQIFQSHNTKLLNSLIPKDNELIEARGFIDPMDEVFYKPIKNK